MKSFALPEYDSKEMFKRFCNDLRSTCETYAVVTDTPLVVPWRGGDESMTAER